MVHHKQQSQSGFALLMTLMVVAVIVSVTAAIVELSIKQVELSVTSRDSEIAFQAANAGMECARYARRDLAPTLEDSGGSTLSFKCFGKSQSLNLEDSEIPKSYITKTLADTVEYYTSDMEWGTGDRCSQMKMLIINTDADSASPVTVRNLDEFFPGFPAGQDKVCEPGGYCTVAQVTGYNVACADISPAVAVRREILLEF